jgi:chromosome partitioning protein
VRKICIAVSKGGTGKTTTAVNLSAGLAKAGHRVLLVDTDVQGQCSKALGVQPPAGLAELILEEATLAEATYQARERLRLLAGGRALAGVKRLIARKDFGGERTLSEALQPAEGHYDYVILDTSPSYDVLNVNSLFYCHEILAPVSLEILTLLGLADFQRSLQDIQEYHGLELRYVLPTFYDRRVSKSDEILSQLQAYYPEQVCSPIRYNVRLSEAAGFGQTIFEYSPSSAGAQDYGRLTEEVAQDAR